MSSRALKGKARRTDEPIELADHGVRDGVRVNISRRSSSSRNRRNPRKGPFPNTSTTSRATSPDLTTAPVGPRQTWRLDSLHTRRYAAPPTSPAPLLDYLGTAGSSGRQDTLHRRAVRRAPCPSTAMGWAGQTFPGADRFAPRSGPHSARAARPPLTNSGPLRRRPRHRGRAGLARPSYIKSGAETARHESLPLAPPPASPVSPSCHSRSNLVRPCSSSLRSSCRCPGRRAGRQALAHRYLLPSAPAPCAWSLFQSYHGPAQSTNR